MGKAQVTVQLPTVSSAFSSRDSGHQGQAQSMGAQLWEHLAKHLA